MPLPALPHPLLLFRQICLLAAVAGILAWREAAPGILCLLLLWLLDLPRSGNIRAASLLVAAFVCGFSYAQFRERSIPPMPGWLTSSVQLIQDPDRGERRPPVIRLEAAVKEAVPLPDNRLRIILTDIGLVKGPESTAGNGTVAEQKVAGAGRPGQEASHYGGDLVWTWKDPAFIPLPGTRLQAEFRPMPVRDMANPGTWSAEQYWRDRSVFLRSWSKGGQAEASIASEKEVPLSARFRAGLRQKFLSALFLAEERRAELFPVTQGSMAHSTRAGGGFQTADSVSAGVPGASGLKNPLSPGASILPALLFGDRSFISPESTDRFARATLAHSLALSGLHLGYAAAAGFALAWLLGMVFPSLLLRMPRPKLALFLALPLAGSYLWLGQAPVSLARASLMLAFWALLLFLHRPKVLLDGLLAAVSVLLLFDPCSLFDISLQLSALSVAVIALTLPAIQGVVKACIPGQKPWASFLRGGLAILCISFCIQLVLMPLTIRSFGTAGIWFPLNILWLPVLGAWVMPFAFAGLLLAALELQAAASCCLTLAAIPGNMLFSLLGALDGRGWLEAPVVMRPRWLFMAGFWLLCLLLPGLWRRMTPRSKAVRSGCASELFTQKLAALRFTSLLLCCALFLALPFVWSWQGSNRQGVRVYVLDVGQGQALLVEWGGLGDSGSGAEQGTALPSSGRVLIDGGGFSSSSFDVGKAIISPSLTDNRLPRLDAVINSHPDTDHLGGLLYILRHFTVGAFMKNSDEPPPSLAEPLNDMLAKRDIPALVLSAGQRVPLGPQLFLEVLWPQGSRTSDTGDTNRNSASLVLRLVWKGQPLLLACGDAEAAPLRALLQAREKLEARVLLLPHHGSGNSLVPGFYEAVRPDIALASCGYGNPWGFPSPKAWKALQSLGVPVYSTARSGQIRLEWQDAGNTFSIEGERGLNAYSGGGE